MKPDITDNKNKYPGYVYAILLISAILPALFAVYNIKISPDSMIYSLMSQEIMSGNGIKLPIIMSLEDDIAFINGAIPYSEEPFLLPILFAILGGVTPQSFLAAQIINVISNAAVTIFTYLLMKHFYNNNYIALLTGILVSISFPLLRAANHIWSESLFIALTAAVMYFLALSRDPDRLQLIRDLFVASICTSAAVLTRYAGVALIPVLLWGIFILIKKKRIKLGSASTILTALLPILTTGTIITNSYIMTGTILGRTPPSPDRSYLDAFTGTVKMIFLQFNLGERPIALITIFLVLFVLYILLSPHARKGISKYINSGLDLFIVFFISYTVLITYAMATVQTVFELRFMYPLVPFLLVLCVLIIVFLWEITGSGRFSKLSFCAMILSLGVITFGNCYKTYLQLGDFTSKQVGEYSILNSPAYKWIKENYAQDIIITSNKPFHLSFFGKYSTVKLPHKRFNKNFQIPQDMESLLPDRMSKFGSQVLALFVEVDEQNEGSYIARLFNKRDDDDNFVLIRKFSDGVVYRLKE